MKRTFIYLLILSLFCLCGCKKENEATPIIDTTFETDVNEICEAIAKLDQEMNSITPDSEQSVSDMLHKLDAMEDAFDQFAALDFTDNFSYLQQYADEAKDYMKEAVSVYKEIYSITDYDSSKDEYAKENYRRAFRRLQAILAVLRGDDPNNE